MADTPSTEPPARGPAPLLDRRRLPAGVVPRHLQQWVLGGIGVTMIAILALTGPPPVKPTSALPPGATAIDPNATRIEDFQRRVQEQTQRLVKEQAQLQQTKDAFANTAVQTGSTVASPPAYGAAPAAAPADRSPHVADNVAYSRPSPLSALESTRTSGTADSGPGTPALPALPPLSPALLAALGLPTAAAMSAGAPSSPAPPNARAAASTSARPLASIPGRRYRLTEGTVLDAVLTNRLDSTFAGPVNALVSVPAYAADTLVIPAGARVLGESKAVTTVGQTRLAVAFHRLLLPSGDSVDLDALPALNPVGDVGLTDQVNAHYGEIFGASIALGVLAGFANGHTTVGFGSSAEDQYRQGVASSLGQSGTHVLDRFLNRLPTVTIREGHRLKVYLSHDLELPAYGAARAVEGGRR